MKSLLCWLGFAVLLSAAEKPNVLFLLSDESTFSTGSEFVCDGGLTA